MKLRSKVIFTWVVTIAALLVPAKAPAIAQDAAGSMGRLPVTLYISSLHDSDAQ